MYASTRKVIVSSLFFNLMLRHLGVSPDSKTPIRRPKVLPASGNGAPIDGGSDNTSSANEASLDENLSKLMEGKMQYGGMYLPSISNIV